MYKKSKKLVNRYLDVVLRKDPAIDIFYRCRIKYNRKTSTNTMHKMPANIAQLDPFSRVVLFSSMKITAVAISNAIANTVTSHMTIFGRNNPNSITNKLSPTEISTAQSNN